MRYLHRLARSFPLPRCEDNEAVVEHKDGREAKKSILGEDIATERRICFLRHHFCLPKGNRFHLCSPFIYNCRLIRISVKGIMSVDNNRLRKVIHRKSTASRFTRVLSWIDAKGIEVQFPHGS